jgi:predicted deacetylase
MSLRIKRCSLLVVPNHHQKGSFLQDENFSRRLRELAEEGHEIVAHGYYHLRERRESDGIVARLITRSYTAGEGEFYDISREAADELLRRAREDFLTAGLCPCGFIAPAWLLSPGAELALRDGGWLYTTRLRSLLDLPRMKRVDSQSLVYSVRSSWRRETSLLWNQWLYRHLEPNPLMRMSIHPPDFSYPKIKVHILRLLAEATKERTPQTYAEFVQALAV